MTFCSTITRTPSTHTQIATAHTQRGRVQSKLNHLPSHNFVYDCQLHKKRTEKKHVVCSCTLFSLLCGIYLLICFLFYVWPFLCWVNNCTLRSGAHSECESREKRATNDTIRQFSHIYITTLYRVSAMIKLYENCDVRRLLNKLHVFLSFSISMHRYMIESPRWLVNRGKYDKAAMYLNRIAKINNKSIKQPITGKLIQSMLPKNSEPEKLYGMLSLFSGLRLAKNTIILMLCW